VTIKIEVERAEMEKRLIGLHPNTNNVRPVHIANGLFRSSMQKTFNTQWLHRFVFSQLADGKVPPEHDIDTVYEYLVSTQKIEQAEISKEALSRLRVLLKKIIGADNAVFTGTMQSYTAGFANFITQDTIAGDGGELISVWLQRKAPSLHTVIESTLQDQNDIITQLCAPLLNKEWTLYPDPSRELAFDYDEMLFLKSSSSEPAQNHWDGLAIAAETLALHLQGHPNKLLRLRLAVLFSCFVIMRHLS